MASFFVIDQSLNRIGGHHFDTVRLVCGAATQRGFNVIAGTHRDFDPSQTDLLATKTCPAFRNTTYTPLSLLNANVNAKQKVSGTLPDEPMVELLSRALAKPSVSRARKKLSREFARDCEKLFRPFSIQAGDHALLLTANELEFRGLAQYLAKHPETTSGQWHVVFHLRILQGRPPAYRFQQQQLEQIRNSFQTSLALIPNHQVTLLTSTEELAEQYNLLDVGQFSMVPYPIDPELANVTTPSRQSGPVELTLAGGQRREKGKAKISDFANDLNQLRKAGTDVRLTLQKRKRKWYQKSDIQINVPRPDRNKLLRFATHPLPEQEYRDLINHTDVGVLLYDSDNYYARRAGVLCEYLSAGRPVAIPGGCWLHHQIAESTFKHVDQLVASRATRETQPQRELNHVTTNAPDRDGVCSFDDDHYPFEIIEDIDYLAAAIAVQFDWHWPEQRGVYASIELVAYDGNQQEIARNRQVVGHRAGNDSSSVLFRLPVNAHHYALKFTNAYDDSTARIKNIAVTPIGDPGEQFALGAVGSVFVDCSSAVDAVSEVVDHLDHYTKTAQAFAENWSRIHEPLRTIDALAKSSAQSRAA